MDVRTPPRRGVSAPKETEDEATVARIRPTSAESRGEEIMTA